MKKTGAGGAKRPFYAAGLVALIVGTLALAAVALTVIFADQIAFQVDVFGRAEVEDEAEPLAIRGASAGEVTSGFLGDLRLPEPDYGSAGGVVGDPVVAEARRLAGAGEWDAALSLYDRLGQRRTVSEALAIERARVLSWAGRPLEAADAMREVAGRRPGDTALRIEAASFYWWGGDAESADEMLSEAARLGAAPEEIAPLQRQVRGAFTPDAVVASRWVTEEPTWENRLALARAHLSDERWLDAVDEFDRALLYDEAPDSAYLEMAAAATAADSVGLAVAALREYLDANPGDHATRLSLARTYSWGEEYEESVAEYRRYLEVVDDPTVRFELAQILTWMERNDAAARELRRVALAQPRHAPTYRLLGDLALWSGDYELAIANYRYASDLAPSDTGVRVALQQAEVDYGRQQLAALPLPLGACSITFESFTDSEGFAWVETRGSRVWRRGWGAIEVQAHQALSGSDHSFAGGERRLGGMGASVALYLPVSRTARVDLLAGTTDYGDFGTFAEAALGIEAGEVAGATVTARASRQSALRRAATIASLQAGTTSDLLEVTASRSFGEWAGWSSLEAERLASDYGTTYRYGANLSASRPITSRLSVSAAISALTTSGDTPALPDGRSLYWTPELYLAPSVGLTYRHPLPDGWSVAGTVTPGWAYVRERATGEQRFGQPHQPTLGASVTVGYTAGDWNLTGIANWGGALDPTGYRASTVRVQGSYQLGEP